MSPNDMSQPFPPRPMLMSAETEYSVSGLIRGQRVDPPAFFQPLQVAICTEQPWLPDHHARSYPGIFLGNGARFYPEINGHPEYAQPEANTPREVAAHDKAGERILRRAASLAMQQRPELKMTIVKNNLDTYFPDEISFGTHESYTCWRFNAAPDSLLPHLATRIIYTGSGCLSARAGSLGYELSQRARHIVHSVGTETTGGRALFCTRLRKSIDQSQAGYVRAHLISRDSLRLPLGTYLAFGATGLLFHHVNQGRSIGSRLSLKSPVEAMQTISFDPWLKARVRLQDGRDLTAIDIQQALLDECAALQKHDDVPAWAEELLAHWAGTLDNLRLDPLRLADRLDAYLKLAVFQNQIQLAGFRWTDIRHGLRELQGLRRQYPAAVVAELFGQAPVLRTAEETQQLAQARKQLTGHGNVLRFTSDLQLMEINYHTLGNWCDDLVESGDALLTPLTDAMIADTVSQAPPGSRAACRGHIVRQHSGSHDWCCDWASVARRDGTVKFDLSDPFANHATEIKAPPSKRGTPSQRSIEFPVAFE